MNEMGSSLEGAERIFEALSQDISRLPYSTLFLDFSPAFDLQGQCLIK